jgi:hypothetical protein
MSHNMQAASTSIGQTQCMAFFSPAKPTSYKLCNGCSLWSAAVKELLHNPQTHSRDEDTTGYRATLASYNQHQVGKLHWLSQQAGQGCCSCHAGRIRQLDNSHQTAVSLRAAEQRQAAVAPDYKAYSTAIHTCRSSLACLQGNETCQVLHHVLSPRCTCCTQIFIV